MTNHCMSCNMCCRLLKVEELNKPDGKWCQHAKPGKGCGIYDSRPSACRSYQCMWLASQHGAAARAESPLPASMRPDRSKVMIEMGGPKGTNLVLHVDPGRPMAWRENANIMKLVNACLNGGNTVFVVTGDRRTMLTPPQEAEQAQA